MMNIELLLDFIAFVLGAGALWFAIGFTATMSYAKYIEVVKVKWIRSVHEEESVGTACFLCGPISFVIMTIIWMGHFLLAVFKKFYKMSNLGWKGE